MKKLYKNVRILPMSGPVIEKGDILVDAGKIIAAGSIAEAICEGAEITDASGLTAMPGIVDAHCHIGLFEDAMGFEGSDGNEATDPVTPDLRAIDAINPMDRCFYEARVNGVTTVITGPGSANVIGGQFAALKTLEANDVEDMVFKAPQSLKLAFGENPKRVYSNQKRTPSTRMATAAVLRRALVEAQEYKRKIDAAGDDPAKLPDRDLKKEILVMALERKIQVKAHAHRADDILTALRIGREFGLDMTIEHAMEAHLIIDKIKRYNVRCILGPLLSERSKIELKNLSFKAPAILSEAGAHFALMSDHPVIPNYALRAEAAMCVENGLAPMEALRALTLYAAEITGVADRVGSIEPGKDADIAFYDGDPLDVRTKVRFVLINGEIVRE